MTVFAIMGVKDEADVIAGVLQHVADEVDEILIADNGSTDGTRDILDSLDLPIRIYDDHRLAYYQSERMSWLSEQAGLAGATWVCPIDADEIPASPVGRIRDVLNAESSMFTHHTVVMYNHLRTALDVDDPDPFRSMVWRQPTPGDMPKVFFRYQQGAIVHQGNHGVTLPRMNASNRGIIMHHYPVRSAQQFIRKAVNGGRAYAATNLPDSEGEHWRSWHRIHQAGGDQALTEVFNEHWFYRSPVDSNLIRDPGPYQRWRV